MKHQYEALASTENGEAIQLERPVSPDTLINDQTQETDRPTRSNATNTPAAATSSLPTPMPLPNNMASVSQVRQHIVKILQDSFNVPPDEAQRAASHWQGLGHRFRKADVEELKATLGEPYASMIQEYRDAAAACHALKKSNPDGAALFTIAILFILFVAFGGLK